MCVVKLHVSLWLVEECCEASWESFITSWLTKRLANSKRIPLVPCETISRVCADAHICG